MTIPLSSGGFAGRLNAIVTVVSGAVSTGADDGLVEIFDGGRLIYVVGTAVSFTLLRLRASSNKNCTYCQLR